ncbi:epoxide hydrolase N-terminal domain-containing protein [Micromonospora sp. BRA006-A]|nr:epoxide hydrolase N-terminal domain-containing protein [Micromonospora sp. BRA006-A]
MVLGRGIAVTAVALMYQWALTTRIARGRGTAAPKAFHAEVYRLTSRAFIGLPWPRNAAGIKTSSPDVRLKARELPSLEDRFVRRGLPDLRVTIVPPGSGSGRNHAPPGIGDRVSRIVAADRRAAACPFGRLPSDSWRWEHDRVTPFHIDVPEAVLDDLRARLSRTRLAPAAPGEPWAAGTDPGYLADLVRYWLDGFDWRAVERALNRYPSSSPRSGARRSTSFMSARHRPTPRR